MFCQTDEGGAMKSASNPSGWLGTTRWGTPGSLVRLCNTIITHPSLISHPSPASLLTVWCTPSNYYHSGRPNMRKQIILYPKNDRCDQQLNKT